MKYFRFAFLVILIASSLMIAPDQAAEGWGYCGYNEPYSSVTYYEYPGGPQCGFRYIYCYASTPPYHEGCWTSYFDQWYNSCECP